MAAFCTCCGAEITRRTEACPGCGTPRHGMLPDLPGLPVGNKNVLPETFGALRNRGIRNSASDRESHSRARCEINFAGANLLYRPEDY